MSITILGVCGGCSAVDKVANAPRPITSKDNPLRDTMQDSRSPYYHQNMTTLRRDVLMRETPINGRIYAGIMDNMRYGGSE